MAISMFSSIVNSYLILIDIIIFLCPDKNVIVMVCSLD